MSIQRRPNGKWRARYRDPAGREHSKHFATKQAARRFLAETTTALVTGQYVDPGAGKILVRDYAELWRARQSHLRPGSAAHYETMLRRHLYPELGGLRLRDVRAAHVADWVRALAQRLEPSTVHVVHGIVSALFAEAVRHRLIVANPCGGTKLPRKTRQQLTPLTVPQVTSLAEATPPAWRAAIWLAAGTGLRIGEVLGLARGQVDLEDQVVRVNQQLVTVVGRPPFLAAPKTDASVRSLPLAAVTTAHLRDHLDRFGVGEYGLLFCDDDRTPMPRNSFSAKVWKVARAGADLDRSVTFHDLRHFYASLLIRYGESVKTVQARLGHASARETLDTYSHLWPDAEESTRTLIDRVLPAPARGDDG